MNVHITQIANLLAEYILYLAFPAILTPFLVIALALKAYPTRRAVLLFLLPTLAATLNFIAQGTRAITVVALIAD